MLYLLGRADAISWDMVQKEAATGKGYLHKHKDVHGRPVIVIKSALHKTGKYSAYADLTHVCKDLP